MLIINKLIRRERNRWKLLQATASTTMSFDIDILPHASLLGLVVIL